MTLIAQARAIAAAVEAACSAVKVVYPTPPSTVGVASIVVSPAPEFGTFDDGSFCGPDVSWELILVSAVTDFAASLEWFYARISELAAADTDTFIVDSWGQPELISLGSSGEGLAVRVRLAPQRLEI